MAVLDELSGFEFEDVMEDVFRKLGYENVRQAERTSDEGRDLLMEEVVDGERRSIVVECKHTGTVGRPVVQKLHSAIATFDSDGPRRGIVVTSGRFTAPARAYARRLRESGDPYPIELIDGTDIREFADDIGLDLYNGRIEILCDECLRPTDPTRDVTDPFEEAARDVENVSIEMFRPFETSVTFRPVVVIDARTQAVFETSVGVIHRVDAADELVAHAERDRQRLADRDLADLVRQNLDATRSLDTDRFSDQFGSLEVRRFGKTETEYKNWAVERLRESHTTTVTYTGDNNVTYEKTCRPKVSDISVRSIRSVYLPIVRVTSDIQTYEYRLDYYAAGPSRLTDVDRVRRCVQCGTTASNDTYTHCRNCGSVNCESHTKTERLERSPICTGCAVTERFAFKTKYFYDETNLEEFRSRYAEMPLHRKAMENVPLAIAATMGFLVILYSVLVQAGVM